MTAKSKLSGKQQKKIQKLITEGFAQNRLNNIKEAEELYRQVLTIDPNNADALNLLGTIEMDKENFAVANNLLEKAVLIFPQSAQFQHNLAKSYLNLSNYDLAEKHFKLAIQLSPKSASCYNNLGITYLESGKSDLAIESFNRVINLNGSDATILHNIGKAYLAKNDFQNAFNSFYEAIKLSPNNPDIYLSLGNIAEIQGDNNLALDFYTKGLEIDSSSTHLLCQAGTVLYNLKKEEEAEKLILKALQIAPENPHIIKQLANIKQDEGNYHEAVKLYEKAIHIKPDYTEAICNLGNAYIGLEQPQKAAEYLQKALEIDPTLAPAYYNLAVCLRRLKEYTTANKCLKQAVKIKPNYTEALALLIYQKLEMCEWDEINEQIAQLTPLIEDNQNQLIDPFAAFNFNTSPSLLKNISERWSNKQKGLIDKIKNATKFRHDWNHKKVRIGYLSNDLQTHATAYLMAELFELHNRDKFEIYAFSYGGKDNSEMRKRIVNACDKFIDVTKMSIEDAATEINKQEIDILVELKGYTYGGRTAIARTRPSPINVNWLGYPGTLGTSDIDYIISDNFITPEGTDQYYSEKVVRLPGCYQINDRNRKVSDVTPTRKECGLPENAFVLCNFNQNYKITPNIFDIWMNILDQFPDTVMWLMEMTEWSMANLKKEAEKRGINPERLIFAPHLPNEQHMARYRLADLFIDTFPVVSHTTASDALWVGCPIVTYAGDTFVSRVAGSILTSANLSDLVTYSLEDYKKKIIDLLNNRAQVREISEKLKNERATFTLFDSVQYTKNIENAYLEMISEYRFNRT